MSADLIARLEKATGPDRKLDGLIHRIVLKVPEWRRGPTILGPFEGPNGGAITSPLYTASIDAARTLILPEHSFGGLAQVSPADWLMMIFSRTYGRARWEGEAPTAELAICIAALKARAATPESRP